MEQISERIEETISSLEGKKALLEKHKQQYIDLKFKLYDYEQYDEKDTPEIEVNITPRAKVKANIINPKRILVSLGCDYFVERNPTTAVTQVENKLTFLNKTINDFGIKIREAKKTLEGIAQLQEIDERKKSDTSGGDANNDEDGLPFMDIREELDEDGNIIKSSVQPHNENKLKEFKDKSGIELVDEQDELTSLLHDMGITPRPQNKIEEIKEPIVEEAKQKTNKVNSDKSPVKKEEEPVVLDQIVEREEPAVLDLIVEREEPAVLDKIVEREEPVVLDQIVERDEPAILDQIIEREEPAVLDQIVEREDTTIFDITEHEEHEGPVVVDVIESANIPEPIILSVNEKESVEPKPEESADESHEYFKLLKEFGITNVHTKPDRSLVQTAVQEALQETVEEKTLKGTVEETDEETFKEVISSDKEITEESHQEPLPHLSIEELTKRFPASRPAVEEEDILQLQLISDELDDENDAELDEDDYYYDEEDFEASLNFQDDDEEDDEDLYRDWDEYSEEETDEHNVKEGIIPSNYRELFMKELEKVRNKASKEEEHKTPETSQIDETDVTHLPVSVLKRSDSKEKKTVKFSEELQIKEIENISDELKQAEFPAKVSKFKQNRIKGNFGLKFTSGFNNFGHIQGREETVNDIVERDGVIDEAGEEEDLEDEHVVHDILENDSSIRDLNEKFEEEITPKKVSKFKSSLRQTPFPKKIPIAEPTKIEVPKNNNFEAAPEDEYDNIKKYVQEEDDEDEELLNAITDNISVYRGEEDDDEGNNEMYEDEDDDDVMLVDQIIDNDEVDEPDYFVDNGLLEQEYRAAKQNMIKNYLTEEEKLEMEQNENKTIEKNWDDGKELEPIDEDGNPVKVSRFKKSLGKRA